MGITKLMFFTRKRKNPKNSGYSLLEFAMVVPPMLLFVMGAVDITRVLQAKQALQQGVETTLRCMYPVNGKCAQINADSSEALLNWYRVPQANNPYPVGEHKYYSATAYTLRAPTYSINQYTARVLDTVNYDLTTYYQEAQRELYPISAEVPEYYIQIANGPFATVNSTSDITYAFRQGGGSYPSRAPNYGPDYDETNSETPELTLSITGQEQDSGRITFIVPGPEFDSSLPCVRSSQFNNPRTENVHTAATEGETNCPAPLGAAVPMVFSIFGSPDAPGSDRAVVDILGINIHNDDSVERLGEYGGREFGSDDSDANLVPRGIGERHVENNGGYEEFAKHGSLDAPFNREITVRFRLRRPENDKTSGMKKTDSGLVNSGEVTTWKFGGLKVFTPLYKAGPTKPVTCTNFAPKSLADEIKNNPTKSCTPPDGISNNLVVNASLVTSNGPAATSDKRVIAMSDVEFSESSPLNCDDIQSTYGADESCSDFGPAGVNDTKLTGLKQSCPKDNIGVARNASDKDKARSCPLNVAKLPQIGAATITSYSTVDVPIAVPEFEWSAPNCSLVNKVDSAPVPSQVAKYKDYWATGYTESGGEGKIIPITTPDEAQFREDNDYECEAFTNGPDLVLDINTDKLKSESFFKTAHFDIGCDWEEQVRDHANREKDEDDKPVLKGGYARDIVETDTIEDRIYALPESECAKYEYVGVDTVSLQYDQMELLTPTPLAAPAVPDICHDKDVFCKSELVSLSTENETSFTALKDAAANIGYEEMQVAYPSFQYGDGCNPADDSNCAKITVGEMSEQGYIPVTASINVPLTSLFGNKIVLTHSESERWEGAFAK